MNHFIKSLALFLCIAPIAMPAQQDPMVSQHIFSGHFINPAYVGSHDYATLTALVRKQWVNFAGSPFTTYLSFDLPLQKKRLGVGALLSNDQIGVTTRTELVGTIAYHLPVSEKAKISAGLRLGATHYLAKLSNLTYWDQTDQVFQNDITGKILPVAGAGIYFYTQRFYAGFSIPNVISYKPGTVINAPADNVPNLERHYFGAAGYAIPAGKNLDIKPAILVKYVPMAPVEFDYSLHFFFYKTLWVGATYRSGDGIIGMAEYQANDYLRIGYAYDMSLTHLQDYNAGSHEIMIAWDFVKKEEPIRYKSPRFF